jgi:tetratricopeptide (TPR) repeat protein
VIDASQASASVKESWVTARKSFYQRNYEKSEQSYQNVIDSTEDNFDAYGELGNVYFNQGKNKQAASAYFEAAAILVRKGQVNRAKSLMGLLRHLDKSKADELQGLIDSVTQS